MFLTVTTIGERHAPIVGEGSERVFESVCRSDFASSEANEFVAVTEAATIGVAVVKDVVDDDTALGVGRDRCAKRGMIDHAAALQEANEALDLVDRNGIADTDVNSTA